MSRRDPVRRRAALAIALVTTAVASPVSPAQSSAAAELAFREGRQLMNQGRYQEACPKFAESQRLDSAPGTQLNLADCFEKLGRTATAWETFRAAEAAANDTGQREFAAEARRRAEALEPKLCKLALSAAQPVTGLEVTLDGKPVTELVGSAVPVDPGEHAVAASAPARRRWTDTVRVDRPGTTVSVAIPPLVEVRSPSGPAVEKPLPPRARRRHRMTPLAWGLAAGAGAALAVGVGLDIAAYSDLRSCRDRGGCGSQDEVDSIETRFLVGDILIGVAAASAGGALLAWWFGGPAEDSPVEVMASPGGAAVQLSGRF